MMQHDIAHCSGGGGMCPRKESCYRYLAGLEAQKAGLTVSWVSPLYSETRCVFYLEKTN